MSIITIDFETYYDKDYSLSKMTTEEYINDPRFEVIGVGMKIDDGKTNWYTDGIADVFKLFDWENHAVLCHNTLFDGAILSWKYGVKPGMWFDTLCMARALHGTEVSGSLASLAERYQLGRKGEEVIHALGKRRKDFTDADLSRYGDYCRNDVDLTHSLFARLSDGFPDNECLLIDLTIRMYTEPTLMVDSELLQGRLKYVQEEKHRVLSEVMAITDSTTPEEAQKKLGSNPQFAKLLQKYGVTPPMKISPTTGKETYAFAKTDQGFIDLQGHDDPAIQQICGVRLGTKSTLEESRIERFIGVGGRNRGRIPVPLRYYGAHTGRWSGTDSVNFQNLPSRDKQKKTLKNAIVAPPGHVIINSDSSQIEARVLAWLAGQNDLIEQFRNGEDVYSTFATKVFNKPVSKATPMERFVGKTCILGLGYGTGAAKLQHTLALGNAELSIEECKRIVDLYRSENDRVPNLWYECDTALREMMLDRRRTVGKPIELLCQQNSVRLPNGLHIRYDNLHLDESDRPLYDSRRGPVNIWGGAMVENVVQALARIVIGEQMLWIAREFRPVLTVHDAMVYVVPEARLDEAKEYITLCMSTPPAWAVGLPVACELKYNTSYGEC